MEYSYRNFQCPFLLMLWSVSLPGQFQWIFSSHYGLYISPSLYAWQFLLDARRCEFYMFWWPAGYFCMLTDSLELCSGMQLNCFKTVQSFWILLSSLFRWDQSSVYSKIKRSPVVRYSGASCTVRGSTLAEQALFQPCVCSGPCSLWSFLTGSFPGLR